VTSIYLTFNKISAEGAAALADTLKEDPTVTTIGLSSNKFGDEGATVLADALKVNTSVTNIYLGNSGIGNEGAVAIAEAIEVNASVTTTYLDSSEIGDEGAAALVDALQVNTSLTSIDLDDNPIDESIRTNVDALVARNKRYRSLVLFDARQMLLSLMCADECGVVWPYLLGSGNTDGILAPDAEAAIRAEFLDDVQAERRRRWQGSPTAKRRRRGLTLELHRLK
jgi:Ran GTPase-activating protein (RanGAP) involved in mRNA processing and transport